MRVLNAGWLRCATNYQHSYKRLKSLDLIFQRLQSLHDANFLGGQAQAPLEGGDRGLLRDVPRLLHLALSLATHTRVGVQLIPGDPQFFPRPL